MRTALAALLLAFVLPAGAQVTFSKWQDMGAYVGQQTTKLNTHTDQIAALQAKITALETQAAKDKQDIQNLIASHNVNVQYFLVRACDYNARVAGWAGVLAGLQPIPLGSLQCPPDGTRYYIPYFHGGPSAVPVPPAQ